MNSLFKKAQQYFQGINGLIYTLYFVFVFLAFAIVNVHFSFYYFLIFFVFISLLSIVICPFILKKVSLFNISEKKANSSVLNNVVFIRLALFFVSFSICFFYFVAYYPGGYQNDAFAQYLEVVNNNYSDWHPVMHTLLFFKLPLVLSDGWIGSIVLFQIIMFSLSFSYAFSMVYEHTNGKYTLLSVMFVLSNPQIGYNLVQPWKDNAFAIGAMMLSAYGLQIYFSKGKWIKKPLNTAMLIVVMVLTTLFRHNAILFTIPFMIAIFLVVSKKRALVIMTCFLILIAGIKGPLYSALDVEKPDKRQVEILGLPMTVIGAVVTFDSDSVDEEIKDFAYRIAPEEVWKENYTYGSYNNVKFINSVNNLVIEEYGTKKVIQMMIGCIKASPVVALTGLIKLTEGFFTVSDKYCSVIKPSVRENDYDIVSNGNSRMQEVCRAYTNVCTDLFPNFYMLLGIVHFILITAVLAKFKIKDFADWKRFLFVIPALCYNIATTLLLTGVEDSIRFFYYIVSVAPIILVFVFKKEKGVADLKVI